MFLKQIGINKHAIKLLKYKQSFYKLINNLGSIKLKIFKIYIKINLINGFILFLKSLANTRILFIYKSNGSLQLYIYY